MPLSKNYFENRLLRNIANVTKRDRVIKCRKSLAGTSFSYNFRPPLESRPTLLKFFPRRARDLNVQKKIRHISNGSKLFLLLSRLFEVKINY